MVGVAALVAGMVGQQAGRAVLAGHAGLVRAAGGHLWVASPGARRHFGRPDHRRGEKLGGLSGPFVGGGIEIWFAYVLALVVLLIRPQGLFGRRLLIARLIQF
jgi:branched-chain amino acid transport system permease protein